MLCRQCAGCGYNVDNSKIVLVCHCYDIDALSSKIVLCEPHSSSLTLRIADDKLSSELNRHTTPRIVPKLSSLNERASPAYTVYTIPAAHGC